MGPVGPPPMGPPPGTPGQPPAGGPTTTAGLTRRVRGAQLPNTQTVKLRRGMSTGGAGTGPSSPPPAPRTPPPGGPFVRTPTGQTPVVRAPDPAQSQGWASERSAKDVYGFLSDFTAGVQRRLDETQPDQPPQAPSQSPQPPAEDN